MIKFYFRDKAQKLPIRVNARGFIINFVHITIVTVILRQNRARFWIERMRGRWDAKIVIRMERNLGRDHGIGEPYCAVADPEEGRREPAPPYC